MIIVYCGPMFAGKTTMLMHQPNSICFKPVVDTRTASTTVRTHDGQERLAVPVGYPADLDAMVPPGISTVCIDEAQFFDESLVPAVVRMSAKGLHVVIAGLDLDSMGRPFGPMPALLSVADNVIKLRATSCARCRTARATRTFRTVRVEDEIWIGGAEAYEPRCLACWLAG
jgi:thymidine kinase